MQRMAGALQKRGRLSGGAMLGVAAFPALTGFTSEAQASWFSSEPESRDLEALKAKAAELKAKKATRPYAEVSKEIEAFYRSYAAQGKEAGDDNDEDGLVLAREVLFGTSDKTPDSDGDGLPDGFEAERGLDPADRQAKGAAATLGWTFGYIPMADNPLIEDGTLFYYDALIKDRTGVDPETRHAEGRSGVDGGHYFMDATLDENDAEMTAAKDFNGDGVLTPKVKADFLSQGAADVDFGPDGRINERLSVGWWGHCNNVATAGITFREPKQEVTFELKNALTLYHVETAHGTFKAETVSQHGRDTDIKLLSGQTVRLPTTDVTKIDKQITKQITFTPDALKGLAAELVGRGSTGGEDFIGTRFYGRPATIELEDGTTLRGGITSSLNDRGETKHDGANVRVTDFKKEVTARIFDWKKGEYSERTFKPEELESIYAEDARDVNPIDFHTTMVRWLGSEKKAGVMDKDAGDHVWNYSFDRYDYEAKQREGDPDTFDYVMNVYFTESSYPTEYRYSITYEDGKPKDAAWDEGSDNPDFFWRERGGPEAFDHPAKHGDAALDFKTVIELLQKSYAAEGVVAPGAPPS